MTREEARKAAEVMMAYAEGKKIEYKSNAIMNDKWFGYDDNSLPKFNWRENDYRIKPEPTYRPFKNKEECWAEMQKHQPFGWVIDKNTMVHHTIVALNSLGPYFSSDCGDDYKHLFECASFADGTPFGINEE